MRSRADQFKWALVGLAAVVAGTLGYIGFAKYFAATGESLSFLDLLYLDLQLFVLESGSVWGDVSWELQVARLMAPVVAGSAAVGALIHIFRDRYEEMLVRFRRGHVIIGGLGQKGLLITEALRERGETVVVLEEDAENDLIDVARGYGAVVMLGDDRDPRLLRRAGLSRASHLVAVSGDDGKNAEVAVVARRVVADRKGPPLSCLVHVVDPELCSLLRLQEMGSQHDAPFRLEFFNVFEGGARALLRDFPVRRPRNGDRCGHVVVVGVGRFGESVVLQAARDWWSDDADEMDPIGSQPEAPRAPLRITCIDLIATERVESILARHPWMESGCLLEPLDMSFESRAFAEADFLFDADGALSASTVFVCPDDDSRGLSAGLTLSRRLMGRGLPIVVRTVHASGLASLLQQGEPGQGRVEGLYAFGLLDRMCNPDLLFAGANETLAKAMHDEYVKENTAKGETSETNPSLVRWVDLPEVQKESSRAQAAHIGVKLAAVGCELAPLTDWEADTFTFSDEEVELLARMEHDRWVEEREGAGWTLGLKDTEKQSTPFLVPWEGLDRQAKDLDRLFIRGLPRFLAKAGFQIVRVGEAEVGKPEVASR